MINPNYVLDIVNTDIRTWFTSIYHKKHYGFVDDMQLISPQNNKMTQSNEMNITGHAVNTCPLEFHRCHLDFNIEVGGKNVRKFQDFSQLSYIFEWKLSYWCKASSLYLIWVGVGQWHRNSLQLPDYKKTGLEGVLGKVKGSRWNLTVN